MHRFVARKNYTVIPEPFGRTAASIFGVQDIRQLKEESLLHRGNSWCLRSLFGLASDEVIT
jgi:hypothetical protein